MKFSTLLKSILNGLAAPTPQPAKKPRSKPTQVTLDPDTDTWFDFYDQEVAGESNYHAALLSVVGSYSRDGHRHECVATLIAEPENPYDTNAVRVTIEGETVGYLPKKLTTRIASGSVNIGPLPKVVKAGISGGTRTNQHDASDFSVRLNLGLRAKRRAKA